MNRDAASTDGFLSGCSSAASRRYAERTSVSLAVEERPRASYGSKGARAAEAPRTRRDSCSPAATHAANATLASVSRRALSACARAFDTAGEVGAKPSASQAWTGVRIALARHALTSAHGNTRHERHASANTSAVLSSKSTPPISRDVSWDAPSAHQARDVSSARGNHGRNLPAAPTASWQRFSRPPHHRQSGARAHPGHAARVAAAADACTPLTARPRACSHVAPKTSSRRNAS